MFPVPNEKDRRRSPCPCRSSDPTNNPRWWYLESETTFRQWRFCESSMAMQSVRVRRRYGWASRRSKFGSAADGEAGLNYAAGNAAARKIRSKGNLVTIVEDLLTVNKVKSHTCLHALTYFRGGKALPPVFPECIRNCGCKKPQGIAASRVARFLSCAPYSSQTGQACQRGIVSPCGDNACARSEPSFCAPRCSKVSDVATHTLVGHENGPGRRARRGKAVEATRR